MSAKLGCLPGRTLAGITGVLVTPNGGSRPNGQPVLSILVTVVGVNIEFDGSVTFTFNKFLQSIVDSTKFVIDGVPPSTCNISGMTVVCTYPFNTFQGPIAHDLWFLPSNATLAATFQGGGNLFSATSGVCTSGLINCTAVHPNSGTSADFVFDQDIALLSNTPTPNAFIINGMDSSFLSKTVPFTINAVFALPILATNPWNFTPNGNFQLAELQGAFFPASSGVVT